MMTNTPDDDPFANLAETAKKAKNERYLKLKSDIVGEIDKTDFAGGKELKLCMLHYTRNGHTHEEIDKLKKDL